VGKVRDALATLPWVETPTATFDLRNHLVRFRITDRAAFSLEELNKALAARDAKYQAELVSGPTGT